MRKEVTFEDSESETEYDSEDEFYDDEESDEGGAYQLASDYDIEYDSEDDEGGVLYGGKKRRKESVKKRRRSSYNRFVAKWSKRKKPGTKRYYNMKEIAAKWRKMHGLTRKKRSVSGSKKSMRRRTKRGGILMGGVKKKTTKRSDKKSGKKKTSKRTSIDSLIMQPDIQRYDAAENLCQKLGMMYCPTSQSCREIDSGLRCLSRAGISYIRLKDGNWMTIGNAEHGYFSPLEALEWYRGEDPEKYDGGPILPTSNLKNTNFKSNLGNVPLGPIKRSTTSSIDDTIAKALGIDPANARIFAEFLLKKKNLISV